MQSLLPSEVQNKLHLLIPCRQFDLSYDLNCNTLCSDFQEDITFRFSLGWTALVSRFLGTQHAHRVLLSMAEPALAVSASDGFVPGLVQMVLLCAKGRVDWNIGDGSFGRPSHSSWLWTAPANSDRESCSTVRMDASGAIAGYRFAQRMRLFPKVDALHVFRCTHSSIDWLTNTRMKNPCYKPSCLQVPKCVVILL